ncbi:MULTISPECIES: c-type cytochrome [unclassified Roseitalea]|uniref:c-type cytochrome n=1 Tax=unclassified Roseitalea TaxID=2639107 RepID=UPI00273F0F24|nr:MULTISPECIES: c-type cytochrome [unclassified Roseitalea]
MTHLPASGPARAVGPCRIARLALGLGLVAGAAIVAATSPSPGQSADVLLECSSCHGSGQALPGRQSTMQTPFPDLDGQPARYLDRQLDAFRLGLRKHRQMQSTATALGEGGAPAMARLYADAPAGQWQAPASDELNENGRALALEGAWERGVPPCASCHGPSAQQSGRLAPVLYGQDAAYLAHELRRYANGERRSDTMGRMRAYAGQLSQSEIQAVADYYGAWTAKQEQ